LSSTAELQTFKNRFAMEMLRCQLAVAAMTHPQKATLLGRLCDGELVTASFLKELTLI